MLLWLPLSFALLDMTNDEGKLVRDPVALLHALRTYANRLTIFCQAGGIAVPAQRHPPGSEVEKALAEILASGQPVPNPFETIKQIIGRAVRAEPAKPDVATAKPAAELPDAPPF
jgi:hypothetical protein